MRPTKPLTMSKTSHKKNRPFDFKLIDLVEPQTVLYNRVPGMNNFEMMKAKNQIWKEIAVEMGATGKNIYFISSIFIYFVFSVNFCIMRWGNLRAQFQRELRNCRELCPKEGIIRGSNWPYLERLGFLEETIKVIR